MIHSRIKPWMYLSVSLILLATACTHQSPRVKNDGPSQHEYKYAIPVQLSDGWKTASLKEVNIDSNKIYEMVQNILNSNIEDVHSVLLIKNGKLVLEEYFSGYHREKKHKLASVTKSISSILVGIAVDKKLIRNLDLKVYELFPEYKGTKWIDRKYDITLRHILLMRAGIDWIEWRRDVPLSHSENDLSGLYHSKNPIRYTFEKDLVDASSTRFNYSTGASTLLGEIIRRVSGLSADKFAEKYLFDPLGISDHRWNIYPNGTIDTGGGLRLRPRDMAKIGHMMLSDGAWKNKQIVSERWVTESTKTQVHQTENLLGFGSKGYGYQWRYSAKKTMNHNIDTFYAAGLGGQYIYIFPSLDLVAIFTHKHPESKGDLSSQVMLDYIIPAVLPPVKSQDILKLEPKSIEKYVGEYISEFDKITVHKRGDHLCINKSEGDSDQLFAVSEDQFFFNAKDLGIKIPVNFIEDANGKIKKLILFVGFNGYRFDKAE